MNLLKALAAVSSMTLLSRILGFARDAIIARVFGAGMLTDAFFVAFKIPNLLRRLFAEGAFSQAFVPILAEYKSRRGHDATQTLVNQVGTILTLALVGVALLGVVGAPWVAYVSAPGFRADPDKFALTVSLLRITFPYIVFISLVALAAGILNTHSKFSVPAFAPVLLNVAMIGAALWLAPYFDPPVLALGWGVALGGVLQLAWMLPHLLKIRMLPRPTRHFDDPGVRRVLRLMAPATLGVSVAQISLLINTIFASFLASGSVSWLYYADRLMEFPAGMLGVALGTILLPSLARHYADDNPGDYSKLLDWGLRLTLLLALPAAAALAVLAVPLITTLFHYGAFTATDVTMTQRALIAYSAGAGRADPGQGAGARVLRAAEHPHPGQGRPLHPVRHPDDEPRLHHPARPCRAGAVDRPGGLPQRRPAAAPAEKTEDLPAATGLDRLFPARAAGRRADGGDAVLQHGRRAMVAGGRFSRPRDQTVAAGRRRHRAVFRRARSDGLPPAAVRPPRRRIRRRIG